MSPILFFGATAKSQQRQISEAQKVRDLQLVAEGPLPQVRLRLHRHYGRNRNLLREGHRDQGRVKSTAGIFFRTKDSRKRLGPHS